MRIWSCVWGVYTCSEAHGFTGINCQTGQVTKWHLQGSGNWCTKFLSKYYLDYLDVLTAFTVTFNFTGIMFKVSVTEITARTFR